MDYRAQGRFPNYRNRNFMNQWVPEPWETRWSFSLYGAAQHFTTYPRGYYQGLSSIDEYLLNPGNSSRPTHGHDFPSRDEYATKIPHRMRNGFFGSFESQNTKQGSDPLSYSQYSSNADQYRTRPFPYSFSGAPTPVNGGPRTSSRPPSVAYPDSVEEPDSDHASTLPNLSQPHPTKRNRSDASGSEPDDLPPLSQRCETLRSSSPPTFPNHSPSSRKSSHRDRYPHNGVPPFCTRSFASTSDSNPSTPSRPGSSSPPISPHTNDLASEPRKHSGASEHRRIKNEWRSIQREKRRLKNQRRELRLRETLVAERERELDIRLRRMYAWRERSEGDFGSFYGDEGEVWWGMPGDAAD